VLDYENKPHDTTTKYAQRTDARRKEANASSTGVYQSRTGARRRRLDPLLRMVTRAYARGTMRELGYV
jgi:hypothetical protein